MIDFFKNSFIWASSILSAIFTFVPESFFEKYKFSSNFSDEKNIIIARLLSFVIIFIFTMVFYKLYLHFRKSVKIKGHNYSIEVRYGDLFDSKLSECQKVIPLDECFITKVGTNPSDVNEESLGGQYLLKYPISESDMEKLIIDADLKPERSKSKYKGKTRYASGTIVPRNDFLLMAFAKLDIDGLARLTKDEYNRCLLLLWDEINKYHMQKNVCIPILGSGVTRDLDLTQQELLDIIIHSYKISAQKLKNPCKLIIVCKECKDFSINKIGTTI